MLFDYSKLRGRIREKYGTEQKFAAAMGMGRITLSRKLGNRGGFTQEQMLRAAEMLEFEVNEIPDYFFKASQKREQPA